MWEIVFQYDKQYWELEATLNFQCSMDCPHSHHAVLRKKSMIKCIHDSKKKSRSNPRQNLVDKNWDGEELPQG